MISANKNSNPNQASSVEDSTINLPCLENGVDTLGDLWDCRSSKFTLTVKIGPKLVDLYQKEVPMLSIWTFGFYEIALEEKHLIAFPRKEESYTLKYIKNSADRLKSLKVDASIAFDVGTTISLKGAGNYDSSDKKKFDDQELHCIYKLETFSVRLQSSARESIDDLTRKNILNGSKKCTHVVTQIVVGAEATATILLKDHSSETSEKIGGSFEGSLKMGPVSASAKASVTKIDEDTTNSFEKSIQVKAKPPLSGGPPMDFKSMFASIENISKTVESCKYYKELYHVTGVPLRFVLVPIDQFIDIKLEALFLKLEEDIFNKFMDMLGQLMDFQGSGYIKSKVYEGDRRLGKILNDDNHPLTREILDQEKYYIDKAREFKKLAFETFIEYKNAKKKVKDLNQVLAEYEAKFDPIIFENLVNGFVQRGKGELRGVQIGDTESEQNLRFFTNLADLQDWWVPEKKHKILLKTNKSNSSDQAPPGGTFLALYGISKKLNEIGFEVGVAFPSIVEEFSLTIKILGREEIFRGEDINFALKVMGIAIGEGDPISSRFYQIIGLRNALKLPLSESNVNDMISLIHIMGFLKSIQFSESNLKFREYMSRDDGRWKFVANIEALDTASESCYAFSDLHDQLKKYEYFEIDWIVGNFNLKLENCNESPLLYIFYNGKFAQACFDRFDILILKSTFLKRISELSNGSPLSPENKTSVELKLRNMYFPAISEKCLYSVRINYLIHVLKNFGEIITPFENQNMSSFEQELEIYRNSPEILEENDEENKTENEVQIDLKKENLGKTKKEIEETQLKVKIIKNNWTDVSNIIDLIRVSLEGNEVHIVSTVGKILLKSFPNLLQVLKKSKGWSESGDKFTKEQKDNKFWDELANDIRIFSKNEDPFISKINLIILEFEEKSKKVEKFLSKETPDETPAEENKDVSVDGKKESKKDAEKENKLSKKITNLNSEVLKLIETEIDNHISNIKVDLIALISQNPKFSVIKSKIENFINYPLIVKIKGILPILKSFTEEMASDPKYFTLRVFQILIDDLSNSEKISPKILEVIADFIKLINWDENNYPGLREKVYESMGARDLYRILNQLIKYFYNPKLYKLLNAYNMSRIDDPQIVKKMIEFMNFLKFSKENYTDIWKNGPFRFLVHENIQNPNVIDSIRIYQCKDGIPVYLPKEIQDKIKPLLHKLQSDDFQDWPKIWFKDDKVNNTCVIEVFQQLIARNCIPDDFPKIIRKYLAQNESLAQVLKENDSLFYWNEFEKLLKAPWDIYEIEFAEKILSKLKVATLKKTNSDGNLNQFDEMLILGQDFSKEEIMYFEGQKLDVSELSPVWSKYSELFQTATSSGFSEIKSLIKTPRLDFDELNQISDTIIPYVIQQILRGNVYCLDPYRIQAYIRYPEKDLSTYEINFELDANDIEQTPLFSRLEIFSMLFSNTDLLLCHKILDKLCSSRNFIAIPLLYKNLQNDQFTSILPLLKEIKVENFKLFPEKYRFVVAIRIGDWAIGKSSILNKILPNSRTFYSKCESGNEHGVSVNLGGFVEFTWLTRESARYKSSFKSFWQDLEAREKVTNHIDHPIFIANLHGDALKYPEILQYLANFTTCFMVFWNRQNWSEINSCKSELVKHLGGHNFKNIFVDPSLDTKEQIGENFVLTNSLNDSQNIERVKKVLIHSICDFKLKSKNFVIPSTISSENYNMSSELLQEFTKLIRTIGTMKIKKIIYESFEKETFTRALEELNMNQFFAIFAKILKFSNPEIVCRNLSLIQYELKQISIIDCQNYLEDYQKRRKELVDFVHDYEKENKSKINQEYEEHESGSNNSIFSSSEYKKCLELITQAKSDLISSELTLFEIFQKFTEITCKYPNYFNEFLPNFMNYVENGRAICILNKFSKSLEKDIFLKIFEQFGDKKIYVISIFGEKSSGKSTFLDHVLGNLHSFTQEIVGTQGINMKYLKLDENLKKELNLDGFVILDTEGMGLLEYRNRFQMEKWHRDLLTLILGMSNLTILNFSGKNIPKSLVSLIEIAFLNLTRFQKICNIPDILISRHVDSNTEEQIGTTEKISENLDTIVKNICQFSEKNEFQIGHLKNAEEIVQKISYRLKNEKIIHNIRPFKTHKFKISSHYLEDCARFFNILLNEVRIYRNEYKITILKNWTQEFHQFWESLDQSNFPSKYENIREIKSAFNLENAIKDVKILIDIAFQNHRKILLCNFLNLKSDEESETSFKGLIVKSFSLGKCPENCKMCSDAFSSKENLINSTRENKTQNSKTIKEIEFYEITTRKNIVNEFKQMLFTRNLQNNGSNYAISTWNKLACFIEELSSEEKVNLIMKKVKQYFSENILVISSERKIHREFLVEYKNQNFILNGINGEIPNLEIIDAFQDIEGDGRVRLTWMENDWLQAKFEDLPKLLMSFRTCENDKFMKYLDGMVRELSARTNEIIQEFQIVYRKLFLPKFKQLVHIYALKLFIRCMNSMQDLWDQQYNPLIKILKKEEIIKVLRNSFDKKDVNLPGPKDQDLVEINANFLDMKKDICAHSLIGYENFGLFEVRGYPNMNILEEKWKIIKKDAEGQFEIHNPCISSSVLTFDGEKVALERSDQDLQGRSIWTFNKVQNKDNSSYWIKHGKFGKFLSVDSKTLQITMADSSSFSSDSVNRTCFLQVLM